MQQEPTIYLSFSLPEMGKFIQGKVKGENFLCVGDANKTSHAGLLKKVLERRGVQFDLCLIDEVEVPCMSGQDYQLIGAGYLNAMDPTCPHFFKESIAYGLGFNETHLQDLSEKVPFKYYTFQSPDRQMGEGSL